MPALESCTLAELEKALEDPEELLAALTKAAGPAAKRYLIAQLRPRIQPLLAKQFPDVDAQTLWNDVRPAFDLIDTVEELQAALYDPETFLGELAVALGPAAKRMLVARLRSKIEPHILKQGIVWEELVAVLELVDSIEELREALEQPEVQPCPHSSLSARLLPPHLISARPG